MAPRQEPVDDPPALALQLLTRVFVVAPAMLDLALLLLDGAGDALQVALLIEEETLLLLAAEFLDLSFQPLDAGLLDELGDFALAAAVALVLPPEGFLAVDLQLLPQRLSQAFGVAGHDGFQFGFEIEQDRSCQRLFGWCRCGHAARKWAVASVCAGRTRGSGQVACRDVTLALA